MKTSMNIFDISLCRIAALALSVALAGCGGGGGGGDIGGANAPISSASYSISGTVSGLAGGAQVTMKDNDDDAVTVNADGAFTFATPVPYNGSYAVTVSGQPAGQTCSVSGGTGSGAGVTANVSNISIVCSANTYTIGGTVSGLAGGAQVTLLDNGGDAKTVTANGAFTFATPVAYNGSYAATVSGQPAGQTCSVSGGTGSGAGVTANVSNIGIVCSTNTYTIGGTVSGLAGGAQVTMRDNGGDAKTVTANGAFTFATPVAYNGSYAVTVSGQPTGQTCSVSSGTGSGAGVTANVSNIGIVCSVNTYTIGGTVSDLAGSGAQVTLLDNGGDAKTVTANGAFTFATPVAYNGSYAVTVSGQPTGQTCSVSGGTGSGAGVTAKVSNIGIVCSTNTYTIGGTVSGLAGSGAQVTLLDNGGDAKTVTANGSFTFATPVAYNGSYAVTVSGQPTGQTCSVSSGTGSGAGVTANVSNIGIVCSVNTYTIGGTVSGLAGGMQVTMMDNGGDAKTVTANGAFTFATPVAYNGSYAVSVGTQPNAQTCSVSGGTGSGTGVTANVSNVSVVCKTVYAYVANYYGNGVDPGGTVSQYTIGAGGALTAMTTPTVGTGTNPISVTVDPSGKYAYVVNYLASTVSQYTIDAGGALTAMTPPTVVTGNGPQAVTVDPSGKFAYVANYYGNGVAPGGTVSQYTIGAGGALTAMTPPTVGTGTNPISVTVDPSGKYAYVANYSGNGVDPGGTVSQYTIGAGGALTAMTPPTVVTGNGPQTITVDPLGKYAYVANFDDTVSQYTIGAGGALTAMTPPTVVTGIGTGPVSVTVDPSGKYAYVVNYLASTVSQYTIDAGGALTAMTPPTVGTGTYPISVTVDPSGKYAYVANNAGNGLDPGGTVSQYTIGAGGALTPMTPPTVGTGNGPISIVTTKAQ